MVFQYQYQYQYHLQRGLGLVTYDSFTSLLRDTYSNPVVLSVVVALLPILLFILRGRIVRTGAYRALHQLYMRRREEREIRRAREAFEAAFLKRRRLELLTPALILLVLVLSGLIFTRSLFFVAVTSNSMAPTFWASDLVLVQSIDRRYDVGDIVVFQNPEVSYGDKVIHRIVAIEEGGFRTKGDNSNYPDDWVLSRDDILGSAVTLNGKPIVAKSIGKYFIRYYDPYLETDPTFRYVRSVMSNIHSYGPIYLLLILLLILLSQLEQAERSKVY